MCGIQRDLLYLFISLICSEYEGILIYSLPVTYNLQLIDYS